MIKIYVCSQSVTGEYTPVASDTVNFIEVLFSFSPDWYGLTKTAQFTQNGKTYNVLLEKNTCIMPAEINEGFFDISVFGVEGDGTRRVTTLPFSMIMKKSGFASNGETPIPPTPDLYSQLVGKIEKAVEGIPENLSSFENDAGFITDNDIPENLSSFENDAGFITDNDIPKNLSFFENDTGFITSEDIPQVFVPTHLSQLENDVGYICRNNVGVIDISASAVQISGGSVSFGELDYGLHMGNNRLQNVAEPEADTDGATKKYVDEKIGTLSVALDGIIALQNSLIGG